MLTIDTKNLGRLTKALSAMPALLKTTVLMRTLNRTGDMAKTQLVKDLAEAASIRQREVRGGVTAKRATPQDLEYKLTVEAEFLTGLVFVITRQDERVCPYCIAAEQGGPYTPEQLDALKLHANPDGLIHNNCRCYVIPAATEMSKQLSERGSIAQSVLGVVQTNAPRILSDEIKFAMSKLKAENDL